MHVFEWWEEAEISGGNPRDQGEHVKKALLDVRQEC